MNRVLYLIAILLFYSNFLLGQEMNHGREKALIITDLNRSKYFNGDTLSIRIKNIAAVNRGFTVEAFSPIDDLISYYHTAVYSASLNDDSVFFRKLRTAKNRGGKFVMPDFELKFFTIKANTDTTINFIIKGTPLKKAVLLKLRVTSDIIDDDYDTIYSKPFYIFSLPK